MLYDKFSKQQSALSIQPKQNAQSKFTTYEITANYFNKNTMRISFHRIKKCS